MRTRMFAFGVVLTCAISCAKSNQIPSHTQPDRSTPQGDVGSDQTEGRFIIVDLAGKPVSGAKVMIGTKVNVPFAPNVFTTDASGGFDIPAGWTTNQPVTVDAAGYVRTTYFDSSPDTRTLQLRLTPPSGSYEIKGNATEFGTLKRDGWVDIALIFQAASRSSLINFQTASLISPEVDSLRILGNDVDVPSNLAIPKQTENYILPINLNKPSYRTYVPALGSSQMVAVRARFPVKATVDDIRAGRSILGVINRFEFIGAGIRDVNATGTGAVSDLPVNQIAFSSNVEVVAPTFGDDLRMLAMAMVGNEQRLFPSDIKSVSSGAKGSLRFPSSAVPTGLVVNLLRRAGSNGDGLEAPIDELSAVIRPANQSRAVDFIPLIKAPELRGATLISEVPRAPTSIRGTATFATLSWIEHHGQGSIKAELKHPIWDLYAANWQSHLDIPEFPANNTHPSAPLRWEVLYLGDELKDGARPTLSPTILNTATHVSKNAFDVP